MHRAISVTAIGESAAEYCTSLQHISLPDSRHDEWLIVEYGAPIVTRLEHGKQLFRGDEREFIDGAPSVIQ